MGRRKKDTLTEQISETAKKPVPEKKKELIPVIPTGSLMLNLACSDRIDGGYASGTIVNLIGDSSSGKTFLALSMLAEITSLERFNDYRLIYDDVEHACQFDLDYLFGTSLPERLESPGETDDDHSDTIQDFQKYVFQALKEDKPFIYVLDSFDALSSEEEVEKMEAKMNGKKVAGSYGMEKAKISSQILRTIVSKVEKTKSFILIISQTRDDINPMSFTKKTRAGGRALKFYSTHEIWLAVAKKEIRKNRMIGVNCKAKVSKNKLTGKVREVEFPIYYDYGVDDLQSCINFLLTEKIISMKGTKVNFEKLNMCYNVKKLLIEIENAGKERTVHKLVKKTWNDIEESLKSNRKRKYS